MAKFKLVTWFWYFWEYLKHGDLISITSSVKFVTKKGSHSKDRTIKTSIGTFFCRKRTNDFQFANMRYEWGVKRYILDNYKNYTVFIDGGACVGAYSILLAKRGIPVIAFEPVRENFTILQKNIELNDLASKIRPFCVGLAESARNTGFVLNPVNTGASHIARDQKPNCMAELRTLDSLIPELQIRENDRILIKLDIEGMEREAILGAREFLKRYHQITLVLEDKHTGQDTIQDTLSEIAHFEFGIVDEFNIYAKKSSK